MKKKYLALITFTALALSATACGTTKSTSSVETAVTDEINESSEALTTEATEATEDSSDATTAQDSTTNVESSSPDTAETTDDSANIGAVISDENKALLNGTMQAIYDVKPGSAGFSIRQLKAAAMLLDLSEALTDQADASQLTELAASWAQQNDPGDGFFDEAYNSVKAIAIDLLENPDSYTDQMEETGYTFTHATHTKEYLEYVCNYIEVSRNTPE